MAQVMWGLPGASFPLPIWIWPEVHKGCAAQRSMRTD